MNNELQKVEQFQSALQEMDNVVFKGYLDSVNQLPVVPLDTPLKTAINKVRICKVSRIVYDKNEDNLGKFNNVFSALHSSMSSVVLIVKGKKSHADIFIGTSTDNNGAGGTGTDAIKTLEAAVQGNFPGVDIGTKLLGGKIEELLKSSGDLKNKSISSIAGVPSLKTDDRESFSQGFEKMIDGMRSREYTAVIQATPVTRQELEHIEGAYADIYTALSVFEHKQISISENENQAVGISLAEGVTKTISKSIGETQTTSEGRSKASSTSNSKSKSHTTNLGGAISRGAGLAGGGVGFLLGGPTGALIGGAIGSGGGAIIGSLAGSNSKSSSTSTNESVSTNTSKSNAFTENNSESDSKISTRTESNTKTTGTGKTLQITEKNRRVTALLESVDNQMKRIAECKNYGMWSWGAYFIGESERDVTLGATLYSGVLRGETTGLERNSIAIWNRHSDEDNFKEVQKYVTQLKHPLFKMPKEYPLIPHISHTSLISTREMAIAMSLPQKSLPGIPVFEAVSFGRSVSSFGGHSEKQLTIGSISNFGNVENIPVNLDVNSLTGHTFITGSTGSGKSNTVYSILDKLYTENNIPFLIIEPAKGEYKEVFGGREGVSVFGTNAKLTPLLRINPFSFPEEIHVMEHIDRLIEILNAVWPMYAAMPAILKEAIEKAYEIVGWNIVNSESKYENPVYPDFFDLMQVLPAVINESEYSQEIKGNYAGALVTRVKSLTNGYFRTMFQKKELSCEDLFDKACVVDFSRVGSSETKSLLMGILFLKLQEYRIAKAEGANSELKHITVLEEAHNLLRKTNNTQSLEGANLQGKSVEMISNAIAEMRTYGEGFIIADQAPGLLDQSVVRNTNTKIILRLPDFDDRNLVGKAIRLNKEQIDELSRLRTGCAAVFQNNWQEPVLCQFNQFDRDCNTYTYYGGDYYAASHDNDLRLRFKMDLVPFCLERWATEKYSSIPGWLNHAGLYFPDVVNLIKQRKVQTEEPFAKLVELDRLFGNLQINADHKSWFKQLLILIFEQFKPSFLSDDVREAIVEQTLICILKRKPEQIELWEPEINDCSSWVKEILL